MTLDDLERQHLLGCSAIEDDGSGCDCALPDLLRIARAVAHGSTYAVGGDCNGCTEGHISHDRHDDDCTVMLARKLQGGAPCPVREHTS